ncbi:hypothetical protein ASD21_02925 [Caulobacter sp. Root1455]|uniref:hypothetical protein n=1 Tax=unclassified Caulobacter TaxID=2648921 RepID=UPI0006F821EC|nr:MULTISPECIES: hypothetical protein [unclassified Caulobacter]KQY28773.1 hypothetical protein ASD38_14080 [Caulobacter sp. Root487D2Y]KQY98930.1 hypothetical protein ASD21_02925 [Caulobacter sp. Root1455]
MSSEAHDLAEWCQRQRAEALRQIDLFGAGGVKAVLQMPDGSTQEITSSVVTHQTENAAMFERIASALTAA